MTFFATIAFSPSLLQRSVSLPTLGTPKRFPLPETPFEDFIPFERKHSDNTPRSSQRPQPLDKNLMFEQPITHVRRKPKLLILKEENFGTNTPEHSPKRRNSLPEQLSGDPDFKGSMKEFIVFAAKFYKPLPEMKHASVAIPLSTMERNFEIYCNQVNIKSGSFKPREDFNFKIDKLCRKGSDSPLAPRVPANEKSQEYWNKTGTV